LINREPIWAGLDFILKIDNPDDLKIPRRCRLQTADRLKRNFSNALGFPSLAEKNPDTATALGWLPQRIRERRVSRESVGENAVLVGLTGFGSVLAKSLPNSILPRRGSN
jgi:hypothetical protein